MTYTVIADTYITEDIHNNFSRYLKFNRQTSAMNSAASLLIPILQPELIASLCFRTICKFLADLIQVYYEQFQLCTLMMLCKYFGVR